MTSISKSFDKDLPRLYRSPEGGLLDKPTKLEETSKKVQILAGRNRPEPLLRATNPNGYVNEEDAPCLWTPVLDPTEYRPTSWGVDAHEEDLIALGWEKMGTKEKEITYKRKDETLHLFQNSCGTIGVPSQSIF